LNSNVAAVPLPGALVAQAAQVADGHRTQGSAGQLVYDDVEPLLCSEVCSGAALEPIQNRAIEVAIGQNRKVKWQRMAADQMPSELELLDLARFIIIL
jgi:hypothetical protein